MTFLIDNWYWVVLALGSAALLLFPELAGDVSNKGVDLNEAVRRLNREKAMLVDVRDSAEFAKVHIAQGYHICQPGFFKIFYDLQASVANSNMGKVYLIISANNISVANCRH